MKKFLSVLLTMAMVMSLFTGTVLAVPATTFTITAGTASYTYKLDTIATTGDVLDYAITKGAEVYRAQTGIAVTAADTLVIDTSSLTIPSGNIVETYTLTITNMTPWDHDSNPATPMVPKNVSAPAITITVKNTFTVNGAATTPKAVVGNNTFTGVITNKGTAVKGVVVSILSGTTYVAANVLASVRTDDTGAFSLNVNFPTPAVYSFFVGTTALGHTLYSGINFDAVEDLKLTVTGNPGSIRAANDPHTITFTADRLSTTVPAYDGTNALVNVTLPSGKVIASTQDAVDLSKFTIQLDKGTDAAKEDIVAGTYTVEVVTYLKPLAGETEIVEANKTLQAARTAKTTFTIVDNTSALFINAAAIGGKAGGTSSKVIVGAGQALTFTMTAPTSRTFKAMTYSVTGPLKAPLTNIKFVNDVTAPATAGIGAGTLTDAGKHTMEVVSGGTIVMSGTITYDNDATETFSKSFNVAGYLVEYSPIDLPVTGTEVELKAVVTTIDGVPVNNAKVTWTSTDYAGATPNAQFTVYNSTTKAYDAVDGVNNVVDGSTKIIQNGTYTLKAKLVLPGYVNVAVVSNEPAPFAGTNFAVKQQIVYGAEVYTLKAPASNLIATKATQVLTLETLDADGNAITPDWYYIEDANGISGYVAASFDNTTAGKAKLTFSPGATTGTFNVLLGTDAGKKIVKVPVTIVAPVVTVKVNGIESTKVTAGLLEKVELTFANTAASTVTVTPSKVDGSVYLADKATVIGAGGQASTTGVNTLYTKVVPFKTSTDSKIDIYVDFGVAPVKVATLTVVQPTLEIDYTSLDVGTVVDLNLVLTDANGRPMKDYSIKSTGTDAFAGNATAKTDVDGKAILTVSPNAPGTLTLQIATLLTKDADDVANNIGLAAVAAANITPFSLDIPVQRDTKGPVFEMDAVYSVNTMPATINFNVVDGSKVTEVWIGYEKALVRPDGSVVFTVTGLPVGVTEFDVLAYDYYGNASEATLVVEYLKPATVVLTIGSTDATKDGAAMTGMDQAPTIVNGRTFLPVRFVFVNLLGGTIEWDATTQTITSVVKGSTIKMVVGSKTAFVNGNAVALLEAPYIEAATGRTLVPMREIMEAIGISLTWNATTQTVSIVIPQ